MFYCVLKYTYILIFLIIVICIKLSLLLAFAGLLLCSFPAAVAEAWHRFDVALADSWGVEHKFGWAGQADRESSGTH